MKKLWIFNFRGRTAVFIVLLFFIRFCEKGLWAGFSEGEKSSMQDPSQTEYVPGELIIKLKPGQGVRNKLQKYKDKKGSESSGMNSVQQNEIVRLEIELIDNLFSKYHVTDMKDVFKQIKIPDADGKIFIKGKRKKVPDLSTIFRLKVPDDTDINSMAADFNGNFYIEFAEPNTVFRMAETIPNEYANRTALAATQWALDKIQAPEAWDLETGNSNVNIGIIDTGVDWNHPDLAANIWINSGEDPWSDPNNPGTGNGIDDDGNGYVDDWKGWDFVSVSSLSVYPGEDPEPADNDPMDFQGHGTHCSGICSAVTDNYAGIAGLSWNCKIAALRAGYKAADGKGLLQVSDISEAIAYAADNGIHILSMSFSSDAGSYTMKQALDYAYAFNCILIAAAGNDHTCSMYYPAAYDHVIAVSATDNSDHRASFSNYGSWIDVAAPGIMIYSTYFNNTYAHMNGTSMATPLTAGLAGLILSKNPSFSNNQIRTILLNTTDPVSSTEYIGTGRINAYQAVQSGLLPVAEITSPRKNDIIKGAVNISGSACGTDFLDYAIEYGAGENPTVWNIIHTSDTPVTDGVLGNWNTASLSGIYTLRLIVNNSYDQSVITRTIVLIDQLLQDGWPVMIDEMASGAPVVADLDLDGQQEVVVSTLNKLTVYNSDGTLKSGWPMIVGVASTYDGGCSMNPSLGDLDGDGDLEIVVGFSTLKLEYPQGGGQGLEAIYAFHHDGTIVTGWPWLNGFCKTAAIGDIDGDNDNEIVFAAYVYPSGYKMCALHHDGTPVTGWPQNLDAHPNGAPALGDVDGDDDIEIFGADNSGKVYAWHHDGSAVSGWPQQMIGGTGQAAPQTPILADLENDGSVEIISGSDGSDANPAGIYVWNADGSLKSGWPQRIGIQYGAIKGYVVGDVNMDGDLEIVANYKCTYDAQSTINHDFAVGVWHHDGTCLSNWPILYKGRDGRINIESSPILVDLDGDLDIEIVTGLYHHIDNDQDNWWDFGESTPMMYAWHHDADEVNGWPRLMIGPYGAHNKSCTAADLDQDGDLEIISTLSHGMDFGGFADIYVWDCPGSYDKNYIEWGMYRHDIGNSGNYNNSPDTDHVVVKAKVFLEGPYQAGGYMTAALKTQGYLPNKSPYSDHRSVSVIPNDIVDWIYVGLRSEASGPLISARSFFLKDDGNIVDLDGSTTELFYDGITPGYYYLVIQHRNHAEIMSAESLYLIGN